MQNHNEKGLVLGAIPFKERDRIVTLFTEGSGVIKVYVKGYRKVDLQRTALVTPFSVGEYVYRMGKSDLARFVDGSVLRQNLHLRGSLEAMSFAQGVCEALVKSQWGGKPAPQLFALACYFLEYGKENFEALRASFLLKLLRHEGILHSEDCCSVCHRVIHGGYRFDGEYTCSEHKATHALEWSGEEQRLLQLLCESRSLQKIASTEVEAIFLEKIEALAGSI